MATQTIEQFLSEWKGLPDEVMPISFSYKGSVFNPIKIDIKNGVSYATFMDGGEPKTVCVETSSFRMLPMSKEFIIPSQKPKHKVKDIVRINIHGKKSLTQPVITDSMRSNYNQEMAVIKKINKHGFYILDFPSVHNLDHTFYAWCDNWITPITKAEYDEHLLFKPLRKILDAYLKRVDKNVSQLQDRVREAGTAFSNVNREYMLALEKKNKSSEEIMNQKQIEILKELSLLREDPRIEDVLLADTSLVIKTKPIELRYVNHTILKEFTMLPPYEIRIDFVNSHTSVNFVHGIDIAGYNFIADGGNCHPHVSGSNSVCLGNLAPFYQTSISNFKFREAVKIILELLASYNSGNPYRHLSGMFSNAKKCDNCGGKNVFRTCEGCGHKHSYKDADLLKPFKK